MGMFRRINDIVQSNLNAILDKAEDPQKVLGLIIQEMEQTMVELRSVAASHIAQRKQMERQLNNLHTQQQQWQEKAELAISKEREDLARAALLEKQRCTEQGAVIEQQLDDVAKIMEQLQQDCQRLQDKLTEARAKRRSMDNRLQSASTRLKAKVQSSSTRIGENMARFEQYQQRVEYLEAQVDAYDITSTEQQSLQHQFAQLESEESIEQQLQALRKKVA